MASIPRYAAFDSTLALLREGYDFISRRGDRLDSDIFATRLLLKPVICMRGAAAAEFFYDGGRFTRKGAMPWTTLRLLQDRHSVQLLDDEAHRHRKAMFLSLLLDPQQIAGLCRTFRGAWLAALETWQEQDSVVLFDAANLVLTRAVADWMDLPADKDRAELCRELSGMIEQAGSIGPQTAIALWIRRRCEKYVRGIVRSVREGTLSPPRGSPLGVMCLYREPDGRLLDIAATAVEIINILRPVVAVARYIMFAAMALHGHREWSDRFRRGEEGHLEAFVEEVRRLYPFFPFIGGRARKPLIWRGYRLQEGDWVLLDLHGTDHDERRFACPHAFDGGRGLGWRQQAFDFIPQGGGEAARTHRCPGEAVTVSLTMEAVRLLTRSMTYDDRDRVSGSRMCAGSANTEASSDDFAAPRLLPRYPPTTTGHGTQLIQSAISYSLDGQVVQNYAAGVQKTRNAKMSSNCFPSSDWRRSCSWRIPARRTGSSN